jgi:predicted metal-dependent phosphoesterase TrpH
MEEITVNLHMHTRYSDGSGLHVDIARAALQAGVDVVIVTDHNVLVSGPEDVYREGRKRVLLLVGEEVHNQARQPQKSHLLIVGAERNPCP